MSSIPHGGSLIDLIASADEAAALAAESQGLQSIQLDAREFSDVEMLGIGAFSPLTGFMTRADYKSSVLDMRLKSGLVWGIPITLDLPEDLKGKVNEGDRLALKGPDGSLAAVMTVEDIFDYDRKIEAQEVFKTEEEAHPGVAALFAQTDTLIGGPIRLVQPPTHSDFSQYRLTPSQTRAKFDELGWKTIVGFQTRNPVHRAHEYIIKCAMETVDGLLLHPLVGETKSDDIPADVRMECYEVLLDKYFPKDRVLLSVMPAAMRYGGPREAILHAMVRKNYGCTHFIVGRDHAGVGNYYGTYDAQKIFENFTLEELGIETMNFEHSFWCKLTGGMATPKTSPAGPEDKVFLSGTRVREMLQAGQRPPEEFTRPEVADILIKAAKAGK